MEQLHHIIQTWCFQFDKHVRLWAMLTHENIHDVRQCFHMCAYMFIFAFLFLMR